MTKKILLIFTLLSCTVFTIGQTVEDKVKAIQGQIEKLQRQVASISQRLTEVEQLNIDLRKSLDFGKPITIAQGANDVTYKILSVEGNKAEKKIIIIVQLSTTQEKVDMSFSFGEPSYVDLYSNRQKANVYTIGGETVCPVYKGTPVNGKLIFKDVDSDRTKELKLIEIHGQNNFQEEKVFFKDLKVDWK